MEDFGRSMRMPFRTDLDQQNLFNAMADMASFNPKGPTMKLSRWGSIHESHEFFEPELPGLRLILKEMSEAKEIPNLDLPEDCLVEATDAQLEECEIRQRERKGTIANAHIYASERNRDAMDVFVHATMPLKTMYSDKIFNVKTPADGLGERLAYANGG